MVIVCVQFFESHMDFFYDAQGKPAIVRYDGADYSYPHHLQGNIIGIASLDGMKMIQYMYDAWGKPVSTQGSITATLGYDNPFRYRGYVWDEETRLYSTATRYYNPEWGRWLNADVLLGKPGGLLNHNVYGYCRNNPVARTDSDGMKDYSTIGPGEDILSLINDQDVFNGEADNLLASMYDFMTNGEDVLYTKKGWNCMTTISNKLESVGEGKGKGNGLPFQTSVNGELKRDNGKTALFIARIEDYGWENVPRGAVVLRAADDFSEANFSGGHGGLFVGMHKSGNEMLPITTSFSGSEGKTGKKQINTHGKYTYFLWVKHLRPATWRSLFTKWIK